MCSEANMEYDFLISITQDTAFNQLISVASSFKYLGIIIRSDLNWVDHVHYTLRKAWKALHSIMLILK
jgi:hypothetical protein